MNGGRERGFDTPGLPSGTEVRSAQCRPRIVDHLKDRLVDEAAERQSSDRCSRDFRVRPVANSWRDLLVRRLSGGDRTAQLWGDYLPFMTNSDIRACVRIRHCLGSFDQLAGSCIKQLSTLTPGNALFRFHPVSGRQ